jgi:hypothetical protein
MLDPNFNPEPWSGLLTQCRSSPPRLATDGPFMETKNVLGGLIVIEAPDLNAAVQVGAGIPLAHLGSI